MRKNIDGLWVFGVVVALVMFGQIGLFESTTARVLVFFGALLAVSVLRRLAGQSAGDTGSSGWADGWREAAQELDLKALVRNTRGSESTMRGEIDGHRVTVKGRHGGEPEIEVRFESGLRSMDIDPRRKSVGSGRSNETLTGDVAFDEAYRVRARPDGDDRDFLKWLTPERREILVVLGDALRVDEIDENELEVKLGRSDWTSNELVQAVQLCVLVATILDRSHTHRRELEGPQDAVRPTSPAPQDRVIQDMLRSDPHQGSL